jgi:diaminohydroxyphosphoribosylaminopyrimidine deaminase/5-amino-6-(5-phosphoribosylamino)uracil reductase
MSRALALARRGIEGVSPNPMVGAVIVRRGSIIGEGYHRRFGGPHAEVEAIRDAGNARGADLYVTLEPCGHHGKTPPCAEAVAAARVARVFFAVRDPNPATAGRGPRILRRYGIGVHAGILADECAALNAPFFHWIATRTPWTILKWAMTLDGKTATRARESKWITGEGARAHAHALRRRVDAVLVGTETVIEDDPSLTPRPPRGREPLRVILDRLGRVPLERRLLSLAGGGPGPRLCVLGPRAPARRRRILEARGVSVLVIPEYGAGLDLQALFRELGGMGISQVLVEGGSSILGSCLDQGLAHEVAAFVAPRILGGAIAPGAVGGLGLAPLEEALRLERPRLRRLGDDLLVEGRLAPGRAPRRVARRRGR